MVALSMPGILRSIAYTCLPVTLSAKLSKRSIGLPITFQRFGSLSSIPLASGTGNLAAAAATLPKLVERPLA